MMDEDKWDLMAQCYLLLEESFPDKVRDIYKACLEVAWPYSMAGLSFGPYEEASAGMLKFAPKLYEMVLKSALSLLESSGIYDGNDHLVRLHLPVALGRYPTFNEWLNAASVGKDSTKVATWHTDGEVNEFSDIFIHCVATTGEGSNEDMPFWGLIMEFLRQNDNYAFEGIVWISFDGD